MEVNLTLDVLKAGKRFHATVSFDSDTGELVGVVMYIVWSTSSFPMAAMKPLGPPLCLNASSFLVVRKIGIT